MNKPIHKPSFFFFLLTKLSQPDPEYMYIYNSVLMIKCSYCCYLKLPHSVHC